MSNDSGRTVDANSASKSLSIAALALAFDAASEGPDVRRKEERLIPLLSLYRVYVVVKCKQTCCEKKLEEVSLGLASLEIVAKMSSAAPMLGFRRSPRLCEVRPSTCHHQR